MSDDKSKNRPQDSSRININEPYERDYWSSELGVSPQKLRETVQKVGVMVKDVRKELGK